MEMCEVEKLPPPGWQMREQCETVGLDTRAAVTEGPGANTEHGLCR